MSTAAVRSWWVARPDERAVWFTCRREVAETLRKRGFEVMLVVAADDVTFDHAHLVDA